MLYRQEPLRLGDRPVVLRTAGTGKRASQLMAHAGIQRVTKGLWAFHPVPLTAVERSLLLQQHLGAPGSTLAVTRFNALDILRLPAGYTDHWVHQSLRMPCPKIMQTFRGNARRPICGGQVREPKPLPRESSSPNRWGWRLLQAPGEAGLPTRWRRWWLLPLGCRTGALLPVWTQ